MDYRHIRTIGHFANSLRSLAIGREEQLYAAGDAGIQVFDAAGVLQNRWSTSRPATAIAVAEDGSIYVGEPQQIEIINRSGKHLDTWRDGAWRSEITAIAFSCGAILVGDAGDRSIRRYDSDRKPLNVIGKDNRLKGFHIPNGIVDFDVDANGIVHATNPGRHRIERFTTEGELLGHIGRFDGRFDGRDSANFPGCCNPTNIALGLNGRVYVTEKAGPRAKVLDRDNGRLIAVIATNVFHPSCKNMDIVVDKRGRVYVADTVRLRILVLEPAMEAAS
jgi:sugar lactone lactonase YvrE